MFGLIATPTNEGIKLEWKNLPEGTTRIVICDDNFNVLFNINDLSKITSVIDKTVIKGQEYEYRLEANSNNGWLADSSWKKVIAAGGSGVNKFNLQATNDGIKISGTKISGTSQIEILKTPIDSNKTDSIQHFSSDQDQTFDFTDVFVTSGKEYNYSIRATVGKEGYWSNNGYTYYDDLVYYPRYELKKIKATGGSGDIKITNKPSVTFSSTDSRFTFSKAPEISGEAVYFQLDFNYENVNSWSRCLFQYGPNDEDQLNPRLTSNFTGEWNFIGYWIRANYNYCTYEHWVEGLDDFASFPDKLIH